MNKYRHDDEKNVCSKKVEYDDDKEEDGGDGEERNENKIKDTWFKNWIRIDWFREDNGCEK